MPIEVVGPVSNWAAFGAGEDQTGLALDDMRRQLPRIIGMRLSLAHLNRLQSAENNPSGKHVTVGSIVNAWIDDTDCIRVKVLVDDDVSPSIAEDIRAGKLTGFSLGIVSKLNLKTLKHEKEVIECSITHNPEFKLTSFIADVREVDAETAAKSLASLDKHRKEAEVAATADGGGDGTAEEAGGTQYVISASSNERNEQQQRVANEVVQRVLAIRKRARNNDNNSDNESQRRRTESVENSNTHTHNAPTSAPRNSSAQQKQNPAMSRRQQPQQQQQPQQDDAGDIQQNDQLQLPYENNSKMDTAIRAGRTYQQPPPRSDIAPVIVNFNGIGAPGFEGAGGAPGAHARRGAVRDQFNGAQLAPQKQARAAQAHQQAMFQKFLQQQANEEAAAAADADAGDAYDDGGDDGNYDEQQQIDYSKPAPPPSIGKRVASKAPRKPEEEPHSYNRKKERELAQIAEMQYERSAGQFTPKSKEMGEMFAEYLEFKQAMAQKKSGNKRGITGREQPDESSQQNRAQSLNEQESAIDLEFDANDDADTMRMKLALKKKQQQQQQPSKSSKAPPFAQPSTNASSRKSSSVASAADDDDGDDDDAPVTEREKRLKRALDVERSKSAQAKKSVSSIREKLDAPPSEMSMASDDVAEVERNLDDLFQNNEELSQLLARDDDGVVKSLKETQNEAIQLKQAKSDLIKLTKTINTLRGEDTSDEHVRAELDEKLREKQQLEKKFLKQARNFVSSKAELVRQVSNAQNRPTPTTIKNKLLELGNKDSFTSGDIDSVVEKVETVLEMVSASHDTAAVTLGQVKAAQLAAKHEQAKLRFDIQEKDDLLRRFKLNAASSSAVANRDPLAKATRAQNTLASSAVAAAIAENSAKKGVNVGGGSFVDANKTKAKFGKIIEPYAEKLQEAAGAPIVGAYEGFEGYNSVTMRRPVPIDQYTPQDMFGLPYTCIPEGEEKNVKQRAEQNGYFPAKADGKAFYQQPKRKLPASISGPGMHTLKGAHMTGDKLVLGLDIKDDIQPGSKPLVTRDMFSNNRQAFRMPNSHAKRIDDSIFVMLDAPYSRN